jgi:hypothetical protein
MSQNVFMACYYEHKDRTGHDIYNQRAGRVPTYMNCNVCLYLDSEKRRYEELEAKHYAELQAEHEKGDA